MAALHMAATSAAAPAWEAVILAAVVQERDPPRGYLRRAAWAAARRAIGTRNGEQLT